MSESLEIGQSELLSNLDPEDKHNLEQVTNAFTAAMDQLKYTGALLVVGGAVKPDTQHTPRKDIDLLALVDQDSSFPAILKLAQIISQQTGFPIKHINRPIPDHELDDKFLVHNGSLELQPNQGTLLEIFGDPFNKNWQAYANRLRQENRPFSILCVR